MRRLTIRRLPESASPEEALDWVDEYLRVVLHEGSSGLVQGSMVISDEEVEDDATGPR